MAKAKEKERRSPGEGSIFSRGDGYAAILDLGVDLDGKRRRKYFYGKTRKAVADKLQRAQQQLNTQGFVEPARVTVAEFLAEWLRFAKDRVRPRTWAGYEQICRMHLVPRLGHVRLGKLQPLHVQQLCAEKRESGLSPRMVEYIHGVLHRALNRAVKWQLIPRNMAAAVDPPRPSRQEMATLAADQAKRLLNSMDGDPFQCLYLAALTTGMRQGELCGLKWPDIDFAAGVISVRRALQWHHGSWSFVEPKSTTSRRSLPLPLVLARGLKKHMGQQQALREAAGEFWQHHDLVFTMGDGRPVRPEFANRYLQRHLAQLGLPRVRFHDLRHSFASLLLRQGTHPKLAAHLLGHSSTRLTLDTYSHVLPEMGRDEINKLDGLFE